MIPIITICSSIIFILMLMLFVFSLKEEGEQLKSIVLGMICLLSFLVFVISVTLK